MIAYFAGAILKCADIKSIDIKSGVVANKKDIVVTTKTSAYRMPFNDENLPILQALIENYNKYVELKAYNEE